VETTSICDVSVAKSFVGFSLNSQWGFSAKRCGTKMGFVKIGAVTAMFLLGRFNVCLPYFLAEFSETRYINVEHDNRRSGRRTILRGVSKSL